MLGRGPLSNSPLSSEQAVAGASTILCGLGVLLLTGFAPTVVSTGIHATHLLSASDDTVASSYVTASITPSANKLLLLSVGSSRASTPNAPTVTGCSLTWVQVNTALSNDNFKRVTVFRAMGGSPTSGALTIDFAGQTQNACEWSVSELDGVDQSGTNGSGAVAQSATGSIGGSAATTLSIALIGVAAGNATYGGVRIFSPTNFPIPGSGYTELGIASSAGATLETEWRYDGQSPVDWTFTSTTVRVHGVAVEIRSANQIIAPSVGSLALSGLVPSVTASDHQTIASATGDLVLAGFAPTIVVTDSQNVLPSTGSLVATGLAPVIAVSDQQTVGSGTGALSLTGFAPVVSSSDHQYVLPSTGVLSFVGFAPTVTASNHQNVAAGLGEVVITGFPPTVSVSDNQTVNANLGQLTLTGLAPIVTETTLSADLTVPGLFQAIDTRPLFVSLNTTPIFQRIDTLPLLVMIDTTPILEEV